MLDHPVRQTGENTKIPLHPNLDACHAVRPTLHGSHVFLVGPKHPRLIKAALHFGYFMTIETILYITSLPHLIKSLQNLRQIFTQPQTQVDCKGAGAGVRAEVRLDVVWAACQLGYKLPTRITYQFRILRIQS